MMEQVFKRLESKEKEMVRNLVEMCRIPAYHPSSGGDGEFKKAKHIEGLLKALDLKYKIYRAPDKSVTSGHRPNILIYQNRYPDGEKKRTWLVAHIDVVPPGDPTRWKYPPFEPRIKDGKIYGRGVEDNGQAMITSLYALWALKQESVDANTILALVADEETGSKKGLYHLISKGLFKKDDLMLVPDWGTPSGNSIEIAEKSMLWVRLTTEGKQEHASMPHRGINAFRAGAHLLRSLDEELHEKFGSENNLFNPPFSTFEPTKKEANVPNINTVPGTDVFHFDCRILPDYKLEDVMATIRTQVRAVEKERNVKVKIEYVMKDRSPQSAENSEVVRRLKRALKEVRGIKAGLMGIGGGTCASPLRKKGFNVAVWQTCEGTAHQTNEFVKVENLVEDAKVFSHVFSQ